MKKFALNTICFLMPIVLVILVLETSLRKIPNDYAFKKDYLDHNADRIETLILGSSHSYYGINPAYFECVAFNASHISQSIDLDYAILRLYEDKLVNLEFVVLPIDYFTLFSRTSTGIEAWRLKNYNIYYGLNTSFNLSDYSEVLSISFKKNITRLYDYYFFNKDNISCSELGYGKTRDPEDLSITSKAAAERHTMKDHSYFKKNTAVLYDIMDLSSRREIFVILLTTPAYPIYVRNLDKHQLSSTLSVVNEVVGRYPNCIYLNLLDDNSFNKFDFRDGDHLNDKGSTKLSRIISDLIKETLTKQKDNPSNKMDDVY